MTQPIAVFSKLTIAAALAAAVCLAAVGRAEGYTVVTRDGHVIHVQARPEIRGLEAYMRLAPRGRLAVIQEELIDWARTEAANPGAPRIAVPADATLAQQGAPAAPPAKPLELKIVGTPSAKEPAAAAPAEPAAGAQAEQAAAPVAPAQPGAVPDQATIAAQEAVVKMQKEYAQVAAARDGATESRKTLETELAQLQGQQTGYASADSSTLRRILEVQRQIEEKTAEIGRYESRLTAIRAEVVRLGGSID